MTGRAYTRAGLEALARTPQGLAAEVDDINRWAAGGAPEGEPPKSLQRPEGHVFTRAEVEAMPQDELLANIDLINAQCATDGGIR